MVVFLLASGLTATFADDPKSKTKPTTAKDKEGVAEKKDDSEPDDLEDKEGTTLKGVELLPLGKTNHDVRLPGYEDGVLTSLVLAETLTPVDKEELEMEKITIDMFEEGRASMTIQMKSGSYLMPKSLLSSNETTTITRADFTITGESLDFNTKHRFGRMRGKVTAVFKESAIKPEEEKKEQEQDEKKVDPDNGEDGSPLAAADIDKQNTDNETTQPDD